MSSSASTWPTACRSRACSPRPRARNCRALPAKRLSARPNLSSLKKDAAQSLMRCGATRTKHDMAGLCSRIFLTISPLRPLTRLFHFDHLRAHAGGNRSVRSGRIRPRGPGQRNLRGRRDWRLQSHCQGFSQPHHGPPQNLPRHGYVPQVKASHYCTRSPSIIPPVFMYVFIHKMHIHRAHSSQKLPQRVPHGARLFGRPRIF